MLIKFLGLAAFLLPSLGSFVYGADNNARVIEAIVKHTGINGIDEELLIEKTLEAPPLPDHNANLMMDIMRYADAENTFDGEYAFLQVLALGKKELAYDNFDVLSTLVRCAKKNGFDEDEYFEQILKAEPVGKNRSIALRGILRGARTENNFDEEAAFDSVLEFQGELSYHNAEVLSYIASEAAFGNDIAEDDAFESILNNGPIPRNNANVLIRLMIFANEEDTFDTEAGFEQILELGQKEIASTTAEILGHIARYACLNDVDDDLIFSKTLKKDPVPKEKVSVLMQIVESAKANNGFDSEQVYLKLLDR